MHAVDLVDVLDAEVGRQQTLEECVSEIPKAHSQAVLSREHGEEEGPADEETAAAAAATTTAGGTAPYRTAYFNCPAHAAAAGAADSGAVTLVDDHLSPNPEATDGPDHTRDVRYQDGRDEAVVAFRVTAPMQYTVSLAMALASPRFLDRALSADRLRAIDEPR